MSIFTCSIIAVACGSLLELADQLLWIDAAGYVTFGVPAARYLVAAALVLALWMNVRRLPKGEESRAAFHFSKGSSLSLAAGAAFWFVGAMWAVSTRSSAHAAAQAALQNRFHLLYALALAAGGVWFVLLALQAQNHKPIRGAGLPGGLCATVACLLGCMMRYIERPASNAHVTLTLGLLGSIAGVLFVTALLRAVVLPKENAPRQLAFTASLCLLAAGVVCMGILGSGVGGSVAYLMYDLPLVGLSLAAVETLPRGIRPEIVTPPQPAPQISPKDSPAE